MPPPQQPNWTGRTARRPVAALVGTLALLVAATACTVGNSSPHHSSSPATSPPVSSSGPGPGSADSPGTTGPPTTGAGSPTTTFPGSGSAPAPSSPGAATPVKAHVELVVTYHGWNASSQAAEVDAYASGVLDSVATCTLTLSRAGVTRTASRRATASASTTQCGQMMIPGSQLTAGDWQATVRYDSTHASGSSEPVPIRVP